MKNPNIVYFVVHDLGRHFEAYGMPVSSPNLNAFARRSIQFNQAYCNSPACSPSRICSMTGNYAHVSGGLGLAHMGWSLPEDRKTIVDYLNKDGKYETIHSGMQHERDETVKNRYTTELQFLNGQHTEFGVKHALEYLKARDRSKPFYLNIGSQEPHGNTWELADTMFGGVVPPEEVYIPPFLPDYPVIRKQFGKFQAAILYMDKWFGELVKGLAELGHDKDTILIFTTDHGIAGFNSKGSLYDRGVETALLVNMPGNVNGGTHCNHLIQNIDNAPTILEACGVSVPSNLPGKSYLNILKGEGPYQPHEAIFTERNFHGEFRYWGEAPPGERFKDHYDPVRSIRTPDFHYIRWYDPLSKPKQMMPWEFPKDFHPPEDTWERCQPERIPRRKMEELYHVKRDGLEFVDVADSPEFHGIKEKLAARLMVWMEQTDDHILKDEVPRRHCMPRQRKIALEKAKKSEIP